MTYLLHVLKMR